MTAKGFAASGVGAVANRTERHNVFNGMAFSFAPFVIMYGERPSSQLQDIAP
jgi:hypothetical protein